MQRVEESISATSSFLPNSVKGGDKTNYGRKEHNTEVYIFKQRLQGVENKSTSEDVLDTCGRLLFVCVHALYWRITLLH